MSKIPEEQFGFKIRKSSKNLGKFNYVFLTVTVPHNNINNSWKDIRKRTTRIIHLYKGDEDERSL